jgi:SAM-dependent methyltransferase
MTAGDHFERVAVAYESLRTTDEAPVRVIGQLLPGRPVTGLDIGCGTGRYTRLLRGLLPDGSLLVASDVSAAMLAQLRAASRGHAVGVVPLLAAAEELPLRTASLDLVTAFNCVHHFDLARFLAAAARVLQPGGQLFIYTRTPQQNARTIWGRYFPGFTEHEQRLHSQAAIRDAVRRTDGLTMVAAQTFQHPRTSTAERLGAQAQGRHYSTFSFYTPQELRAAIATFLARLPGPEVCWVDEHLLVIAGASRHDQAEPDGPASPANQAIKDQALQISDGHAGQAPQRRPGGRAQITPLSAQPIAGATFRRAPRSGLEIMAATSAELDRALVTEREAGWRTGQLNLPPAAPAMATSARHCGDFEHAVAARLIAAKAPGAVMSAPAASCDHCAEPAGDDRIA